MKVICFDESEAMLNVCICFKMVLIEIDGAFHFAEFVCVNIKGLGITT